MEISETDIGFNNIQVDWTDLVETIDEIVNERRYVMGIWKDSLCIWPMTLLSIVSIILLAVGQIGEWVCKEIGWLFKQVKKCSDVMFDCVIKLGD